MFTKNSIRAWGPFFYYMYIVWVEAGGVFILASFLLAYTNYKVTRNLPFQSHAPPCPLVLPLFFPFLQDRFAKNSIGTKQKMKAALDTFPPPHSSPPLPNSRLKCNECPPPLTPPKHSKIFFNCKSFRKKLSGCLTVRNRARKPSLEGKILLPNYL